MDFDLQDKKDISKVFAYLRNKLNIKEKELLEIQRSQPCLLAPDSNQIDPLVGLISSLHLSTKDGSFIFASTSNSNPISSSCSTTECSSDIQTIKTLPTKSWLSESNPVKQEDEQIQYRLPMVTQLFSLPLNAFVASSSSSKSATTLPTIQTNNQPPIQTNDQPPNRLPMVTQLLSMPINAFKPSSSSNNSSILTLIEDKPQTLNNNNTTSNKSTSSTNSATPSTTIPPTDNNNELAKTEAPKSIFLTEKIYSKEHWLRRCPSSESESEPEFDSDFVKLDLDSYIEHASEKMRRLHMEYVQAMEKLKTPTEPVNSTEMIKTMYPQVLNRGPTLKDSNPSSSTSKK